MQAKEDARSPNVRVAARRLYEVLVVAFPQLAASAVAMACIRQDRRDRKESASWLDSDEHSSRQDADWKDQFRCSSPQLNDCSTSEMAEDDNETATNTTADRMLRFEVLTLDAIRHKYMLRHQYRLCRPDEAGFDLVLADMDIIVDSICKHHLSLPKAQLLAISALIALLSSLSYHTLTPSIVCTINERIRSLLLHIPPDGQNVRCTPVDYDDYHPQTIFTACNYISQYIIPGTPSSTIVSLLLNHFVKKLPHSTDYHIPSLLARLFYLLRHHITYEQYRDMFFAIIDNYTVDTNARKALCAVFVTVTLTTLQNVNGLLKFQLWEWLLKLSLLENDFLLLLQDTNVQPRYFQDTCTIVNLNKRKFALLLATLLARRLYHTTYSWLSDTDTMRAIFDICVKTLSCVSKWTEVVLHDILLILSEITCAQCGSLATLQHQDEHIDCRDKLDTLMSYVQILVSCLEWYPHTIQPMLHCLWMIDVVLHELFAFASLFSSDHMAVMERVTSVVIGMHDQSGSRLVQTNCNKLLNNMAIIAQERLSPLPSWHDIIILHFLFIPHVLMLGVTLALRLSYIQKEGSNIHFDRLIQTLKDTANTSSTVNNTNDTNSVAAMAVYAMSILNPTQAIDETKATVQSLEKPELRISDTIVHVQLPDSFEYVWILNILADYEQSSINEEQSHSVEVSDCKDSEEKVTDFIILYDPARLPRPTKGDIQRVSQATDVYDAARQYKCQMQYKLTGIVSTTIPINMPYELYDTSRSTAIFSGLVKTDAAQLPVVDRLSFGVNIEMFCTQSSGTRSYIDKLFESVGITGVQERREVAQSGALSEDMTDPVVAFESGPYDNKEEVAGDLDSLDIFDDGQHPYDSEEENNRKWAEQMHTDSDIDPPPNLHSTSNEQSTTKTTQQQSSPFTVPSSPPLSTSFSVNNEQAKNGEEHAWLDGVDVGTVVSQQSTHVPPYSHQQDDRGDDGSIDDKSKSDKHSERGTAYWVQRVDRPRGSASSSWARSGSSETMGTSVLHPDVADAFDAF